MIVSTLAIKRLPAGTPCKLIKSGQVGGEIRGHVVVASGKKKVFVSESGTSYDIKDRPGWVWDRDALPGKTGATRKARELPVNHARSGGGATWERVKRDGHRSTSCAA